MVSSAEIEYEQSSKGHGSDMLHTTARLSPHVQHKTRPAYPSEALTCCCASPGASSAADVMQVPLLWSSENIVRWEVCTLSFHRATLIISNNGNLETCHEGH